MGFSQMTPLARPREDVPTEAWVPQSLTLLGAGEDGGSHRCRALLLAASTSVCKLD